MERDEAARVLGVPADADVATARAAYRRHLLHTHPDVSRDAGATDRTIRLRTAYEALARTPPAADAATADAPAPDAGPTRRSGAPGTARGARADHGPPPTVELVDHDTIAIGAPPDEALLVVIETAHRLGEISYLDASAGLVETVVEFIEAPTSSVLMSLQGRGTGVTDVFCTVEPLSGGTAPPADAVTRLLLATMADLLTPGSPSGAGGPA